MPYAGRTNTVSEESSVEKLETKTEANEPIQLEPTKDEMEQERLMSRYEQVRQTFKVQLVYLYI